MNCYIYTRVSTEVQVDGYSLEAQKERLRREAAHRGMKVVGEYSDEGRSGKNITGRPEFKKMLQDIKSTVPLISAHFVKGVLDNPVYAGKIAYGRKKTEKIEGTRNEFHVVKQDKDDYKLYDGQHEAIIDEDTWYRVQVKRAKNAFKREKTHSLMHEHILSGLLRCPVCGAPMYGVVNRKKKKGSDEFYTDMWYYICKNRKMVSGHLCDYKKHIRQDEVNTEIMQILIHDRQFRTQRYV